MAHGAARDPILTRPFALAFAAHLLHSLSYSLHLHLPGFLKDLGASELDIGVIFGVAAGTAILARPLIGRVMDAHGRRAVILGGGVLASLVCALFLTVRDLGPWVYAVRIGHGLAEAMLFAALFTYAADIVPASRRIEGIAVFGVSGMLPVALGGLVGDAILATADYRTLFLTSASAAVIALLLSLPLREPDRSADHAPPRGFVAALVQPDLVPLWFIGLTFAMAISAAPAFMKTYVMATGEGSVGQFFGAYSATAVVLRVAGGRLPEQIGPKRVLFPALAVMAAGFVLLAIGAGTGGVIAAGVLCGFGHGYGFPILVGFVVARARASDRGAALSIFTALFDAGLLVGGPPLGAIAKEFGYTMMFSVVAGILASSAAVFAIWDRGRPGAP